MNKGWPSLLWNLYGSDGDQAGSYFGTQEANRPLHVLYALDTGTVTVDNLGGRTAGRACRCRPGCTASAGKVLDDQTASGITLASQQVRTGVLTPKVPTGSPTRVYFVELELRQHGALRGPQRVLAVHPSGRDQLRQVAGPAAGHHQPVRERLKALQTLPRTGVSVTAATVRRAGPDGADLATTVTIRDTSASAVAFLLRADVRRGTASGQVLPGDSELQSSIWQGNDITLFPGQSQTLTVSYDSASLRGATPVITVSGWNVPQTAVPAPVPLDRSAAPLVIKEVASPKVG